MTSRPNQDVRVKIIWIFFVVLNQTGYSQETKLVTKDRPEFYEQYYVLQSDKKIKHGNYVKLDRIIGGYAFHSTGAYVNDQKNGYWELYYPKNNNIRETGFYSNDLRDSVWTRYYLEGKARQLVEVQNEEGSFLTVVDANPVICSKGNYRNDKPAGTWEYYDRYGKLFLKYDYDNARVSFLRDETPENREAGFIGSDVLLDTYLNEVFDFTGLMKTIVSKLDLESGRVEFKFTVDENGGVKDIVAIENTIKNKKVYARALETVQSLNGKYYPKKVNNIAQSSEKTITFELNADYWSKHSHDSKYVFVKSSMNIDVEIKMGK